MSNETQKQPEFVPGNIHQLLDTALIPDVEANRRHTNTEKYEVAGHPDLYVRLVRGDNVHETIRAVASLQELKDAGVHVLPAEVVVHEGEPFIVTMRVEGRPLLEELAHDPAPAKIAQTDETYAKLAAGVRQSRDTDKLYPSDVEGVGQYMFGTIAGDPEPKIRLVDMPAYTKDLNDLDSNLAEDEANDYSDTLIAIANAVVDIERVVGQQLPLARAALEVSITAGEPDPRFGTAYHEMVRFALAHGKTVYVDEIDASQPIELQL